MVHLALLFATELELSAFLSTVSESCPVLANLRLDIFQLKIQTEHSK
jgi:hypothetical protein